MTGLQEGSDRPRLHLTPPVGWMNDPNGLLFRDGVLHATFQLEPDQPRWGRMRWGHAVSRDLLHWEHEPIALEPAESGLDDLGCWSGCLIEDDAGRPTIFYTGVTRAGGLRRAHIGLARGDDALRVWDKRPEPVIAHPPRGIRPDRFRDPFVWRDGDSWAMLVGAGSRHALGEILLYRSDDLESWRYVGPFLTTEAVIAADPDVRVEDIDSPCWECPQLVRRPDGDVLIVSVIDRSPRFRPARVIAFRGRVDGDRFVVDRTQRLGLGPDFYAPATCATADGRTMVFGWIPEDPPARGSTRTWAGCLTLPRVVDLDDDGNVTITLAREIERFAGQPGSVPDATVVDGRPWQLDLEAGPTEVRVTVVPDGAASIRFDITDDDRSVAEVRLDPRVGSLMVSRAGIVRCAGRDSYGTAILPATPGGAVDLRLILDGSVLELAANDRITATARLPEFRGGVRRITCSTIGGASDLVGIEVLALG